MCYFSEKTVFTPILERTVFISVPPDQTMYSNRINNIEQTLVTVYIVVYHIIVEGSMRGEPLRCVIFRRFCFYIIFSVRKDDLYVTHYFYISTAVV